MTARSTASTAGSTPTASCETPPWPKSLDLPPETWRDGKFDFNDYLIESVLVGTIEEVDDEDD